LPHPPLLLRGAIEVKRYDAASALSHDSGIRWNGKARGAAAMEETAVANPWSIA
jgi:hypothetical protein